MNGGSQQFKPIIVVDDDDKEIGAMDLFDALAQGLRRRVAMVFLFNRSGELLLQKRADWVIEPNLLSQSAAGHVNEGMSYKATAAQELDEELGLRVPLTEVGISLPSPGFYNGIYKAVIPDGTTINYDTHEVGGIRWIPIQTLETELLEQPELYTTAFRIIWEMYRDKIVET